MWKPGAPRPEDGRNGGENRDKNQAQSISTTSSSTPSKKLSGATRNMRFMQRAVRGKEKTPPSSKDSRKSPHQPSPSCIPHRTTLARNEDGDDDVAADDDVLMDAEDEGRNSLATSVEMYGIEQSIALGRRSFGGFNAVTAENWFRQQQHYNKKRTGDADHDEKTMRDYQKAKKGTGKRKEKRKSDGISSKKRKATKTLDDVLDEG